MCSFGFTLIENNSIVFTRQCHGMHRVQQHRVTDWLLLESLEWSWGKNNITSLIQLFIKDFLKSRYSVSISQTAEKNWDEAISATDTNNVLPDGTLWMVDVFLLFLISFSLVCLLLLLLLSLFNSSFSILTVIYSVSCILENYSTTELWLQTFLKTSLNSETLPKWRIPGTAQGEKTNKYYWRQNLGQHQPGNMLIEALCSCGVNWDSEVPDFYISSLHAL